MGTGRNFSRTRSRTRGCLYPCYVLSVDSSNGGGGLGRHLGWERLTRDTPFENGKKPLLVLTLSPS